MATASPPELDALHRAVECIVGSLKRQGTLFLGGNGGSHADALHIAGELEKDFERPRPLPAPLRQRITELAGDGELADCLEQGLRVHVLGNNPVLTSAVDNDLPLRHIGLAQELCARATSGDVFMAISTSGRSQNLLNAAIVARALEVHVVALTGPSMSPLRERADVVIEAPGANTAEVQNNYVALYHELCRQIEQHYFG